MISREEWLANEQARIKKLQAEETERQRLELEREGTFVETVPGDFLGNLAWGFGESFVIPAVADIASGYELSKSFGKDPWVEESLAGKLGYALGTGAGLLTGIGAVGVGIKAGSKLVGAGTKFGARKIAAAAGATKVGVKLGEDQAVNLLKTGQKTLQEGIKSQTVATKPFAWATRREIKRNPLANQNILTTARETLRKNIIDEIPGIDSKRVNALVDLTLKESAESMHKHFGSTIHGGLLKFFPNNPKLAQLVGDQGYEAVLLATYDVIRGEAGEMYADHIGLSESEAPGLFVPWYKRAMHGAVLGSILAPIRYIPGGKAVQFGKSGMVADMRHIGRFMTNRFRSPKSMTGPQLQTALGNMWRASGKTPEFLKNVPEFTPSLLSKQNLSSIELDILRKGFNSIKKDLPRLSRKLAGEIALDGGKSFWRASIGSLAMNGTAYHDSYEQGILGTDEYPWDKMLVDHYIGMLYMKRGKTFEGRPKMPRFFDQVGHDGNGSEIGRMIKTLDVLGYDSEKLDAVNKYGMAVEENAQRRVMEQAVEEESPEIASIHDSVKKETVTPAEYQSIIEADQTGRSKLWTVHVFERIEGLRSEINREQDPAKRVDLEKEMRYLQEKFTVARALESEGLYGLENMMTKPMTAEEALKYTMDMAGKRFQGRELTADTVHDHIRRARKTAVGAVTRKIRDDALGYIKDSLNALGYPAAEDNMGRLIIHPTTLQLIGGIKTDAFSIDVAKGEKDNPYLRAASVLQNVLAEASDAGYVRIVSGEGGSKFVGEEITKERLDVFNQLYNTSTDAMHQLLFNDPSVPGSKWRDTTVGYSEKDSGFLEPWIMSTKPIWHAMHTWELHERNRRAYDIFSRKEGSKDAYEEVTRIFKGKGRIEFEEAELANVTPEERLILNRINLIKSMLSPYGSEIGVQKIGRTELTETLNEALVKHLGTSYEKNIFSDNQSFVSLLNHVKSELITELTGNPNLNMGLRKALILGLNVDNPITHRNGHALEIMTADRLEQIILRAEVNAGHSATNPITEYTKELIRNYKEKVEMPLRRALENTPNVRFVDKGDISMDYYTPNELKQTMQEMINATDSIAIQDYESLLHVVADLNTNVSDIVKKQAGMVDPEGNVNKELATAIAKLSERAESITQMLASHRVRNDVIGLRTMLDQMFKLNDLNRKLEVDPLTPETIKEYRETLENFVKEQREIQQSKLVLEEIPDVHDYIEGIIDNLHTRDRSDKLHSGNTSISETQYANRWFSGNLEMVEGLKKNPVDLIRKITNLSQKQIRLIGVVDEFIANGTPISSFDHLARLTGLNATDYVTQFIKPFIENRRPLIEAQYNRLPFHEKDKTTPEQMYRDFVMDTMFILQTGLANTKMPMAVFNNGKLEISEASVSVWDRGFIRLERMLGLDPASVQILLAGTKIGTRKAISTRLTPDLMRELMAKVSGGAEIDISAKELLSTGDTEMLQKLGPLVAGTGKRGSSQWLPLTLDQKTMIFINQSAYEKIISSWAAADSANRLMLKTIVGEATANKYLSDKLVAPIDANGNLDIKATKSNVADLVLLTRLLGTFHNELPNIINKNISMTDSRALLKYIKMDSPRTGMVLDKTGADFARAYLGEMLPKGDPLRNPYDTFVNHIYDQNGELTPQRKITIRDEDGTGAGFFDTQRRGVQQIKHQLMQERGLDSENAQISAEKIMSAYKPLAASITNGETYLSLPEMTSILMQKGARADWFVWDKGEVVGFNVVPKPLEVHSNINVESGQASVFVGKTAYKYHPDVDAAMKRNGVYFTDSISFKSSVKANATRQADGTYKEKIFELSEPREGQELDNNWMTDLTSRISNDANETHIFELPRSSIFIKSISGKHDGTMSFAFPNFFTNRALQALDTVMRTESSVKDMLYRYSLMQDNPFGYRSVAEHLRGPAYEHGDNMMQVMGIEGVLQAGGIPSFEFMAPQLEKMTTTEYLGRRNFTSSQISSGSYDIMTAGYGLSLPIREGNIQRRFGGKGISHHMWGKPIAGMFGGSAEGVSLIFRVDKAFIKSLVKGHGVKMGDEFVVTFDGKVLGPDVTDAVEGRLKADYAEIINKVKTRPDITTLGDLALFIDGQLDAVGAGYENTAGTIKLTNESPNALNNIIGKGKSYQGINLAAVDLRTPMAGANDRVITKVEKLIDKKRGPVSEINFKDVLDPQDADYDLDKSSSFFALPGEVLNEVYNFSGYVDPASEIFMRTMDQYIATSSENLVDYRLAMLELEQKRPAVLRSHSVASFFYQLSSAINEKNSVLAGLESKWDKTGAEVGRDLELFKFKDRQTGDTYIVSFKGGLEFVDSIQYVKKLVKETIDIYKESGSISPGEIESKVYEDISSMFRFEYIEQGMGGLSTEISKKEIVSTEANRLFKRFKQKIISQIASIYNLGNLTETMGDGTKRKMSMYELVSTFQEAKRQIKLAGYDYKKEADGSWSGKENALKPVADNIIAFLGETIAGSQAAGQSKHPLIKGLIAMETSMRKNFNTDIPYDQGLARALATTTRLASDAEIVSNAIKELIGDEKRWAAMAHASWEIGQIEDTLSSLQAYGKRNTTRYKALEDMLANRNLLVSQFNAAMTNKENISNVKPRNKKGSQVVNVPTKQFRKGSDGELFTVNNFNPGERVFYKKGDILVYNYKRLKIVNDNVSKQRRAMHKAFARQLPKIETADMYIIEDIYNRYTEARNKAGELIDPNAPTTFNKFGILSEAQLSVLGDFIKEAGNMDAVKSNDMILQFLYRVLTPRMNENVFDVIDYDYVNKNVIAHPSFLQNKLNERLVFTLLDRAKIGKGRTIIDETLAEELHKNIVESHTKAMLLEYNPHLQGDVFRFVSSPRDKTNMSILPMPEVLPEWVRDPNLNKVAKDIMLSYLDGSYFMDPVELTRMTMKLYGNELGETPNPGDVTKLMNQVWNGVDRIKLDPEGRWFKSRHTFQGASGHQLRKTNKNNARDELQQKHKPGGC